MTEDELVGVMARAIAKIKSDDPIDFLGMADAALEAIAAAGCKVMEREPTAEMRGAWFEFSNDLSRAGRNPSDGMWSAEFYHRYFDAAPSWPGEKR